MQKQDGLYITFYEFNRLAPTRELIFSCLIIGFQIFFCNYWHQNSLYNRHSPQPNLPSGNHVIMLSVFVVARTVCFTKCYTTRYKENNKYSYENSLDIIMKSCEIICRLCQIIFLEYTMTFKIWNAAKIWNETEDNALVNLLIFFILDKICFCLKYLNSCFFSFVHQSFLNC